jgi:hypothetical protein
VWPLVDFISKAVAISKAVTFEDANPAAIDEYGAPGDLIARGDGQYAALHPAWVESLA